MGSGKENREREREREGETKRPDTYLKVGIQYCMTPSEGTKTERRRRADEKKKKKGMERKEKTASMAIILHRLQLRRT